MPSVRGNDIGVYAICNKRNSKRYVGSAAYGIKNRWWIHLCGLRAGTHCNKYLQNAWKKHGEKAFKLVVLELCSKHLCVKREQYWIDHYRSANPKFGYNRNPKAGSMLGFRHSEETKKLVGEKGKGRKHREDTKARISARMSIVMTERWKKYPRKAKVKKKSTGHIGFVGRRHTEEAKRKISAAATEQWKDEKLKSRVSEKVRCSIVEKWKDPEYRERHRVAMLDWARKRK